MGKNGERNESRMSLSELPPIKPRPETGSGKSRQSSGGSNSAGNTVANTTKRYSIKYSERPSLISAEDSGIVINGSESGRFTSGRDPIRSPGSGSNVDSGDEGRAASFNGTNNSASEIFRPAMRSRSKTWGSDAQKPPTANKLHTLYEKKNGTKYVRQGSVTTASENAKNNDALKLPSAVNGGQSSNKSSYSFTFGKRTQSYSNLSSSKYSVSSRGNNNNNTSTVPNKNTSSSNTNLHKVRSDQNIYYKASAGVNADCKLTSRSQVAPQSGRKTRMSNAGKHLYSKSQPNMQHALSSNRATSSNQYRKKFFIGDGGKISQSLVKYNTHDIFGEADEKDKRIIDWLIEIEKEAERPESPEIDDDEPPQTDTAIHVIYGQD